MIQKKMFYHIKQPSYGLDFVGPVVEYGQRGAQSCTFMFTLPFLLTPNEADSDFASNMNHVSGKNQWLSNERTSDIFHVL